MLIKYLILITFVISMSIKYRLYRNIKSYCIFIYPYILNFQVIKSFSWECISRIINFNFLFFIFKLSNLECKYLKLKYDFLNLFFNYFASFTILNLKIGAHTHFNSFLAFLNFLKNMKRMKTLYIKFSRLSIKDYFVYIS